MKHNAHSTSPAKFAVATTFAVLLLASTSITTVAHAANPEWQPKLTERLIRLPVDHLRRAVDNDFADSSLASAIGDVTDKVGGKSKSIQDLSEAAERADSELSTELRHQALVEKQSLVKLMGERVDLKRKHLSTKVRLYKRLLKKAQGKSNPNSPSANQLAKNFEAATNRFDRTVSQVDMKLFKSSMASESKYSKDYRKNMAAIEQLVAAINAHPMNQLPEIDGKVVGKEDYLRQLVATTESELAILDQEESILGYMAKLVALDAMALSEGLTEFDPDNEDPDKADPAEITSVVDLFVQ